MKLIFDKIRNQLLDNLPFVVYKKPNSSIIKGIFQKNDTLFLANDFTEKGFFFASFDGRKNIIIPKSKSLILNGILKNSVQVISNKNYFIKNKKSKSEFENLVKNGIKAIENKNLDKVVLSRKETINLINFDLVAIFKNLCALYPAAFVYCFSHPKVGLWIGSSPEQFLKLKKNNFEISSLAGTKKAEGNEEIIWGNKEKEEQQIVTNYILEKIKPYTLEIDISKPYSFQAGNIWHIKTDITGKLNLSLKEIIKLLHPTPAICGIPINTAKEFILKNENYKRSFYTGLIGELNMNDGDIDDFTITDLFVNLRCMEIEHDSNIKTAKANLYMGCGITKDSIPKNEWEESVNKSMTMKRVLY